MSSTLKNLLIVLGLSCFLVAIVLLFQPQNTQKETKYLTPLVSPRPTVIATKAPTTVRESFRQEYMDSCVANDPAYLDYCTCTWVYFTSIYSLDEIYTFASEYEKTGVYTEEMNNAIMYCLREAEKN